MSKFCGFPQTDELNLKKKLCYMQFFCSMAKMNNKFIDTTFWYVVHITLLSTHKMFMEKFILWK